MNLYKVIFANNEAISAERMYARHYSVEVSSCNGKRLVRSMTIYADDEMESIKVANNIVRDFFSFLDIT